VITSHIHYGRSKLILSELKQRKDVELQIVVGGSGLLRNYGEVLLHLEKDGFKSDAEVMMTFEGGNSIAMAKTAGIGISEFATAFQNLKPDIVVVRGDRYEILSAVIAAAYLNISVAHIEGGDVTGTIDESVRHAVTKLSHIHFATNEHSKERILRMGEDPQYVFNVGCPETEYIARNNFKISNKLFNRWGVGDVIDTTTPYIMVMAHPVTTEIDENRKNTEVLLRAIFEINIPTIWFWPNVDAGTDSVSKAMRVFREKYKPPHMRFVRYLASEEFVGLLGRASCLVGNSSAGIKECSFLGVPVVNIGTRQNGRMRAQNVLDVGYNKSEIKRALTKQLSVGKYEPSHIYYQPNTSKKITDTLAKIDLYTQKRFVD